MKFLKSADSKYWIALVAIIALLFFGFSDKQFSVLFTLSGTVQTFGFALIILKITKSRSVAGLSRETFVCYTLIFAVRAILFRFYTVRMDLCRVTCLSMRLATSCSRFRS